METPFAAYTGDQPFVFVCYAHEDSDRVYPEMAWLSDQDLNLWYDEGISAGKNWRTAIGDSLLGASHVLFYISEGSLKSDHCNREINLALDEGKDVVPVYLEEVELTTDLKVGLNRVQALHRDNDTSYRLHLLTALGKSTASPAQTSVPKKRQLRVLVLAPLLVVAVLGGGWWYTIQEREGHPKADFKRSVTILPFTTLGSTPKLDAYAVGLTQEVTGLVGSYQELQTISPVEGSLPANDNPQANYQVKASVQQNGTDVRVRTQLTRTFDGQSVWSQTFDRGLDGDVQQPAKLATTIARSLRAQLVRDHQCENLTRKSTSKIAAEYTCAALADNQRMNQGGVYDANVQMANAEKALALDPDIPEAYFIALTGHNVNFVFSGSEQSARRARELLDKLPADVSNDFLMLQAIASNLNWMQLDYVAAQKVANRAIEVDPLHPFVRWVHAEIGMAYIKQGNAAAAIPEYERAIRIYDSDTRIYGEYAHLLVAVGHFDDALRATNSGLSITQGGFTALHLFESKTLAQLGMGDIEAANQTIEEARTTLTAAWRGGVAHLLARVGRVDEAREMLRDLEALDAPTAWSLVPAYIALGDHDKAFIWLRRSVEDRTVAISYLRIDPIYRELHQDPRWAELMAHLEREEAIGQARWRNQSPE